MTRARLVVTMFPQVLPRAQLQGASLPLPDGTLGSGQTLASLAVRFRDRGARAVEINRLI